MKPIPFSIELWQQGYRPVSMNPAIEVTDLRHHDEIVWVWREKGRKYFCGYGLISQYILLLPPEDEMIVTIEVMRMNESGMKYIHISDVGKIKPGKYRLTKIG